MKPFVALVGFFGLLGVGCSSGDEAPGTGEPPGAPKDAGDVGDTSEATDKAGQKDGGGPEAAPGLACSKDSDCRLVEDYCGGCNCHAEAGSSATAMPAAVCGKPIVACLVRPCLNQVAACKGGMCVVTASDPTKCGGSISGSCPTGQTCECASTGSVPGSTSCSCSCSQQACGPQPATGACMPCGNGCAPIVCKPDDNGKCGWRAECIPAIWYTTCGDGACKGYVNTRTKLRVCTTEKAGAFCNEGDVCVVPDDKCNRLLACSTHDPKAPGPGMPGCPTVVGL